MDSKQVPLDLSSLRFPFRQAGSPLRLCVQVDHKLVEVLEQPNHKERHFIVGELERSRRM